MRAIDADLLEPDADYDDDGGYWAVSMTQIHNAPTIEPERQWIPCSERLPKPYEYCLWTTTDGRVVYHHCDGLFSNYIAWMPLPEPYKERREG